MAKTSHEYKSSLRSIPRSASVTAAAYCAARASMVEDHRLSRQLRAQARFWRSAIRASKAHIDVVAA